MEKDYILNTHIWYDLTGCKFSGWSPDCVGLAVLPVRLTHTNHVCMAYMIACSEIPCTLYLAHLFRYIHICLPKKTAWKITWLKHNPCFMYGVSYYFLEWPTSILLTAMNHLNLSWFTYPFTIATAVKWQQRRTRSWCHFFIMKLCFGSIVRESISNVVATGNKLRASIHPSNNQTWSPVNSAWVPWFSSTI